MPQMKPSPNSGPMPTSWRTNHRTMTMIAKRIILALSMLGILATSPTVEAATLMPPGKACFNDENGDPLAAGTINFYIPATTTPKNTYQDSASTVLNTNPVVLNSAGCAIIYGDGTYREVVKDSLGNLIWDQLTASTGAGTGVILYGGTSTGSANAQTIVPTGFTATDGVLVSFVAGFSNTGATTLDAGTGGVAVRFDSASGPVALTGNEIRAGNAVVALYTGGFFHLVGGPEPIQYQTLTNYQAFTASGTWTKPTFAASDPSAKTYFQCWGGGGGGGANATAGGGGGGGYVEGTVLTSTLGATEAVTVGTGGAVSTAGTTSFVSNFAATEGGAGANSANGGGGGGGGTLGFFLLPGNGAGTTGGAGGGPLPGAGGTVTNSGANSSFGGGGGGGGTGGGGGDSLYGGGGGGGGTGGTGGDSTWGGGGGGGSGGVFGASSIAGNGGSTGVAGTAPGGGGGRNAAGARGECRIWTTP